MCARKHLPIYLITLILILLLTACSPFSAPGADNNEPKAALTRGAMDEPSATVAQPPETPAEPVQSRTEPATLQPEARPNGAVIAPDNLARLAPRALDLPEYTERILWPKPSGMAVLRPDASPLLQSGASLHPVALDLGADQPVIQLMDDIALPLNGNQVIAFAPDAASMLVQEPGRLALYSPDGRLLREINELERANSASFSPDSVALAITSQEEFAAYVYGADGSIINLTGFETAAPVYSALLGPQGRTLVWISRGTLQFHDVTVVKISGLGTRLNFTDFIGPVVFSPDGNRLALYVAGRLYLYSAPGGELLAEVPLDDSVHTLDFSPAGDILAGNYRDGIQTWDGRTLEPLVTLPSGGSETIMVSFSPDGRTLVTTHNNNELRVWVVK
ncbi:MAG TPA: hypothetical protein VLH85_06925 [Levilinea sp.]|nr:hypothetical protein [Levilinea sp.]